jgi:hypothetical protein
VRYDGELVGKVMNEVKRVREERAERSDFADFQARYYRHLEGLGVSAEDVVELAAALSGESEGF